MLKRIFDLHFPKDVELHDVIAMKDVKRKKVVEFEYYPEHEIKHFTEDDDKKIVDWLETKFKLTDKQRTKSYALNPSAFGKLISPKDTLERQEWLGKFFALMVLFDDEIIETSKCFACTMSKLKLEYIKLSTVTQTIYHDDTLQPYILAFMELFKNQFKEDHLIKIMDEFMLYVEAGLAEADEFNCADHRYRRSETDTVASFERRAKTIFFNILETIKNPEAKHDYLSAMPVIIVNDCYGMARDIKNGDTKFNYMLRLKEMYKINDFNIFIDKVVKLHDSYYEESLYSSSIELIIGYILWHAMSQRYKEDAILLSDGSAVIFDVSFTKIHECF